MADGLDISDPLDALPDTDVTALTGGVQDLLAPETAQANLSDAIGSISAAPGDLAPIIDALPADEALLTGEPLSQEQELLQQEQEAAHLQEMLELQQHEAEDEIQNMGGL